MIITLKNGNVGLMNDQEKIQFTHMQTDIETIKHQMTIQGSQLDKMYYAIMGSELARDGGLVGRIEDLEKDTKDIKDTLIEIKADASKNRWHVNVMWGASGAVIMALFSLFLSYIFKK